MAATDWSRTPLGPPDRWPPALRVAVDVCLGSRFPMFVWWGPDLINVYNDAYAPILGRRHPDALGRPAQDVWREIWPVIGPQADAVMARGEATWNERVLLVMERNGFPEDTWFTWSYSPIRDEAGRVVGLFCACTEETARVRAEAALRESEARRAAALAVADLGTFDWDVRTGGVSLDDRSRQIFGFAPGEGASEREVSARVHPDDLPRVRAESAAAHHSLSRLEVEYRVVRPDGSVRTVVSISDVVAGPDGQAERVIGVFGDVTDRRRADERRRMSEFRFQRLVEHSPLSTQLFWPDGRTRQVNRAFTRLFGITLDQLRDYNILRDPQLVRTGIMPLMERAFAGEAVVIDPIPYAPDRGEYVGQTRWAGAHVYPVKDDAGRVEEVVLVHVDVTEQRLAEDALRESEERFRAAFEQSVVGIALSDLDGRIRRVNAAYCALVGRSNDDLVGHTSRGFTHPDDVGRNLDVIGRLKAQSEPSSVYGKRYLRPDGTVVHAQISIAAVRDPAGTPTGLVAIVEDVTERTRNEAERAALTAKLERQTRLFDAALSAVRDYFFLFDRDGRFVYANKALLDLWGTTAEQALGRTPRELGYPPEVDAQLTSNLRAVFDTGGPAQDETTYTSPTGTAGHYEYILAAVPGPDGSVELVAGTSRDITARKALAAERERLLAALENERARLAGIIEQAPAFICTLGGSDHVFEIANERYYEIVGRRDIVGKPVRAALPEVEGQGFFELLDDVYRTGMTFAGDEMPVLLRRTEGGPLERRFLNLVYQPLREPDGRTCGIFVHGVDVTDLVRSREALRESEAYLRAALDASAGGFYAVDGHGVTTTFNAAFLRMLGFDRPEEAANQKLHGIIHHTRPDGTPYPADECPINLAARYGRPAHVADELFFRRDGTSLPVEYWTQPIIREGEVRGAVTNFIDISDRKRAEARIREESNVVETINRVGRSVAADLDLGRLVQTVTDATTELTGAQFGAFFYNVVDDKGESYSLYALAGAPREAFERFGMPRNTDVFAPTFAGRGVVRLDDVTADPRFGRNVPHHGMPAGHLPVRSYLAVPVVSRSGEVLGGLFFGHERVGVFAERHERLAVGVAAQAAVAIDNARLYEAAKRANAEKDALLDSERAARAEAERQGRLKDEFVSTLSHELRTPLNAILGYAQLMRRDPTLGPDAAEGLGVIERNARVQAQIVEDILDVSRLVSGKMRLDVQPVDLSAVLDAALETCKPAADAKGIRLVRLVDPLAGPVNGDPARLQQCAWNLVSNAIKFSPRGARVQVVLRRVNSHVEVVVSDTGQGIKPEFLPHVFDRFRQEDASTTRRAGGLGLGLSIVKSLVELHGGSVRAQSEGEGRGATFTISLPLAPVHAASAGPDREHPRAQRAAGGKAYEPPSLAGVRVLVVDDEPDARELVRLLLEECGAAVTTAGSAEEALAALDAGGPPPDLLVSDIGMPEVDGYELIRRVRRRGPGRGGDVLAVALTAYARSEDRTRAMIAGFTGHVAKPVEPAELVATVAALARRP